MENILRRIYYFTSNGEIWNSYQKMDEKFHQSILKQLSEYDNILFSYFDLYKNKDEELEKQLLSKQYKGYIINNELIFIDNPDLKAAEEFYNKNKGDS